MKNCLTICTVLSIFCIISCGDNSTDRSLITGPEQHQEVPQNNEADAADNADETQNQNQNQNNQLPATDDERLICFKVNSYSEAGEVKSDVKIGALMILLNSPYTQTYNDYVGEKELYVYGQDENLYNPENYSEVGFVEYNESTRSEIDPAKGCFLMDSALIKEPEKGYELGAAKPVSEVAETTGEYIDPATGNRCFELENGKHFCILEWRKLARPELEIYDPKPVMLGHFE